MGQYFRFLNTFLDHARLFYKVVGFNYNYHCDLFI